MGLTADQFYERLEALNAELEAHAKRACELVEHGFNSFLMRDRALAERAIKLDDAVDKAEVEIERAVTQLLVDAAGDAVPLPAKAMRSVLTLVQLNDSFESIADGGVTIAETTLKRLAESADSPHAGVDFPPTTRVMTNSVIGMLRDCADSCQTRDAVLARLVLQSEDAITAFKSEILRQAEQHVADGSMTVELAFDVHELASQCMVMTDHATGIAEQLIFETTGVIVRHLHGKWVDVKPE